MNSKTLQCRGKLVHPYAAVSLIVPISTTETCLRANNNTLIYLLACFTKPLMLISLNSLPALLLNRKSLTTFYIKTRIYILYVVYPLDFFLRKITETRVHSVIASMRPFTLS